MYQCPRTALSARRLIALISLMSFGCTATLEAPKQAGTGDDPDSVVSEPPETEEATPDTGDAPPADGLDRDGDGVSEDEGDCDDDDASVYPGAPEYCGDGIDSACAGGDSPCLAVVAEGPLVLRTQADMASFCARATAVDGDLTIEADSDDLTSLACLLEVRGTLSITGERLESLRGLGSLRAVDGDLILERSARLQHIDGLDQLARVGGTVELDLNTTPGATIEVARFPSLAQVGSLQVPNLRGLASALELPALTSVAGELLLQRVDEQSFPELPVLAHAGSVTLRQVAIARPSPFPMLEAIDGALVVEDNPQLEDLRGFDALHTVGTVQVADNVHLRRVTGFASLLAADAVELSITDTSGVSTWFAGLQSVTGHVELTSTNTLPHLNALEHAGSLDVVGAPSRRFPALPKLHAVEGDLTWSWPGPPTDFASLPVLTHIGGDLTLDLAPLHLELPDLTTVGDDLVIEDPEHMVALDAPLLATIGGSLTLQRCFELQILELGALTAIDGSLTLSSIRFLTDDGWHSTLAEVGGDLTLNNLINLRTVDALDGLTEVGGDLRLQDLQKLTDPYGLSQLTAVDGDASATGLPWLPDDEATWLEDTLSVVTAGAVTVAP